jgi:hypothetical protein
MNRKRPARSAPHPAQIAAAARNRRPALDRTSRPAKPKPPRPRRITRTRQLLPGMPQRTGKHTSPRTIHNCTASVAIRRGDAGWGTEDVPSLLGRPARSCEQSAADYAAAFT